MYFYVINKENFYHLITKISLTMRLSSLFLFFSIGVCWANHTYAQNARISIDAQNQTIAEILETVEHQSEFSFIYDGRSVDTKRKVSVQADEDNIFDVLDQMFSGSEVAYTVINKKIILKKGEEMMNLVRQDLLITGTVTDETGEPLPGVNVALKGTNTGTITDVNGRYRINVPNTSAELTFTFVGYSEQTIPVGDQRTIDITMSESTVAIDEVEIVAIGYGSIRRRDVTGSVASADMSEMQKATVSSVLDGLAGRVSGIQIISADGTPGQGSNVVIRGGNSLTGNNNPLYVVDGFPQAEEFDVGIIDPTDIESLDILKDASSTAIYGSRGANGVIIITTKKGQVGKPTVNYKATFGINNVSKRMDVMSPYDFVAMEYQRRSEWTQARYLRDRDLESYRDVKGAQWEDQLFRQAITQTHSLSIRGGAPATTYNFTGSYYDQDGVIIKSNYKRYSGKIDLDQKLAKWLKGGVSIAFTRNVYTGPQPRVAAGHTYNFYTLYNTWAYMPVRYTLVDGDPDFDMEDFGNELIDPDIDTASDYRVNPILSTKNEYRKRYTNVLTANAYLDFKITNHLSFKTIGQVYQNIEKTETFNNSFTRTGHPRAIRKVNGTISNAESLNLVNENILTYTNRFNVHSLNVVAAASFEKYGNSNYGYAAEYLPNETKGMSGIDEGNSPLQSAFIGPGTQRMSSLGRIIYEYDSRYLATVSMRADASSMFVKGNRWGYFPSASVGWRFSEEKFLAGQKVLSNGKFRASWGWTGNDRINASSIYPQMDTPVGQMYPFGNNWEHASFVNSPGNMALLWERTVQTNFGIDLGFLKDRIALVVDVYRKNTHDLLLDSSLPGSTGFSSKMENIGQIQNQGLEISLTTVNIQSNAFTWKTDVNISFNQNKVIKLSDGQPSRTFAVGWDMDWSGPAYIAEIGKGAGQMYGYVWDGVYQNSDFVLGDNGIPVLRSDVPVFKGTAHQPGDIKYRDVNGDGVVDDSDLQVIGNTQPFHKGGINNTFTYKGFDMSVFFRWSYGSDVLNVNRLVMEWGARNKTNQFASFVNRWTQDNQNTTMQRLNSNGILGIYSSRIVEDASFLRLDMISFGYSFPKAWLEKVHVGSARLAVTAQNLYTWSKYSGYDPEVSAYNSTLTPNFDYSTYPRARTINFTLNLTF